MVAKGMYVDSRSGWFSERSICYLACGRPVLAQDTGLAELYPAGTGLITFSALDEAVAGVESIVGDYARHAARRTGNRRGVLRLRQGADAPGRGGARVIAIFGSCVSRDLFEHPRCAAMLGPYAARSSVISAVAPPVPIRDEAVILPSAWQRRCVLADFHKTHFGQLAAGRPQWLVIDLIDERFDLLRAAAARYVTRPPRSRRPGWATSRTSGSSSCAACPPRAVTCSSRRCRTSPSAILEVVPAHRVVLHRALWCTRYREDGEVH